jgi:hypothetical protein
MFKHQGTVSALVLTVGLAVGAAGCATAAYPYRGGDGARVGRNIYDRAYRDGYEAGRNDARRRARYNPAGSRAYREAGRYQDRRPGYGRNDYPREYRLAFRRGYDDGYRSIGRR